MADKVADFMAAIDREDIAFLKSHLARHPELMETKLDWDGGYAGFALNYAAWRNKPQAITFFATEMRADVNRNQDVGSKWTPLHHARKNNAYAAAARLMQLGADPKLGDSGGDNTVAFVNSEAVKKMRDPEFTLKLKEKLIAGTWSRTGTMEITHNYEQPDSRQRLTDVFNFETRIWRATVKDMDGAGMAQNIIFFDDMPDRTVLQEPLKRLQALGGQAGEDAIDGNRLPKKSLKMGG